jgi:hypothetical protein
MQNHLPVAYPAKAVPPLSASNNWLHSCRLSIAEKRGANNQQEQSKAPLTVRYVNSHNCQANTGTESDKYKQETKYGCMQSAFPLPILQKQSCP